MKGRWSFVTELEIEGAGSHNAGNRWKSVWSVVECQDVARLPYTR